MEMAEELLRLEIFDTLETCSSNEEEVANCGRARVKVLLQSIYFEGVSWKEESDFSLCLHWLSTPVRPAEAWPFAGMGSQLR
jgi:hypothetical protein